MRRIEFNNMYEHAKTVKIFEDDFFNTAGYFWVHLSNRQFNKMIDLMIEQGQIPDENNFVYLQNGIAFRKSK